MYMLHKTLLLKEEEPFFCAVVAVFQWKQTSIRVVVVASVHCTFCHNIYVQREKEDMQNIHHTQKISFNKKHREQFKYLCRLLFKLIYICCMPTFLKGFTFNLNEDLKCMGTVSLVLKYILEYTYYYIWYIVVAKINFHSSWLTFIHLFLLSIFFLYILRCNV